MMMSVSSVVLLLLLVFLNSPNPANAFTYGFPVMLQSFRKGVTTLHNVTEQQDHNESYVDVVIMDSDLSEQDDENPLWPNGVSAVDIDELVDEILADKEINIPSLPDFLERQIYKTTALLTLNAAYRLVGWAHGKRLWGHYLSLTRKRRKHLSRRSRQKIFTHMKRDVDEKILEQVADQLLANQAINQPLIPDYLERQLYVNCLKIIFRILNMLAASLRITVCGHDLTLNLERTMDRKTLKQVAITAASSKTPIDTAILQEVVRANAYLDANNGQNSNATETDEGSPSLWKRGQQEFVVQVNTVLYSLILGILDDLLANTELQLMADSIQFDIVPPKASVFPPAKEASALEKQTSRMKRKRKKRRKQIARHVNERQRKKPPILAFVFGAVVGIATGKFLSE